MTDIVILVFVGAVSGLVLPSAKDSGMRRVFSFLVGLCILLSICRPIAAQANRLLSLPREIAALLLPQTEEMEKAEENARSWVIRYSKDNIEAGVSRLVENRYGWQGGTVETEAITDTDTDGNLVLTKLILYIDSANSATKVEVARYISDILACPCEVRHRERGGNL